MILPKQADDLGFATLRRLHSSNKVLPVCSRGGVFGHRFRASLGIKVPGESLSVLQHLRGDVSAYVRSQLHERAGKVGFVWEDSEIMAGWACSW
jgi:hypothetical protein